MTVELRWGARTYVMGIVNVTPDSFSGDGLAAPGRSAAQIVAAAVEQAGRFVEAGAEILDVGAESTRPAAYYGAHPPVDAETEAALAVPVVRALVERYGNRVLVSVDTTKGGVARAVLEAGAGMVNDVWAGHRDPDTVAAAAEAGAYLVLMHNRDDTNYPEGLLPAVLGWLADARDAAVAAGVDRGRILVDPGIGFGKTPEQSIEVLRRLGELRVLGQPILVGTSRKRFIGELLGGLPPEQRVEGTAASVTLAIAAGADVVRVHDVKPIVRAVRVADGIVRGGEGESATGTAAERAAGDRITLSGMRFSARHGLLPTEREEAQEFEVELVCRVDLLAAAETDDLARGIDYRVLYEQVRQVMAGPHQDLIESLAARVADAVLAAAPRLESVEARVRKLRPSLPGPVAHAEAALTRSRS